MPTMSNRDRDVSDYRDHRQESRRSERNDDREISLGTGTILAIFFALSLLCAVFFGFGYSMGRKSAQPAAIAAAPDHGPISSIFGGPKPAAGSLSSHAAAVSPAASSNDDSQSSKPVSDPDAAFVGDAQPVAARNPANPKSGKIPSRVTAPLTAGNASDSAAVTVRQPPRTPAAPSSVSTSPASTIPVVNSNGTAMVQIAAVSHQEDADVLLSALKRRGYAVFVRQEPQDHLLHVQVGPFATRRDADAMRQRLLADGYNAIVK